MVEPPNITQFRLEFSPEDNAYVVTFTRWDGLTYSTRTPNLQFCLHTDHTLWFDYVRHTTATGEEPIPRFTIRAILPHTLMIERVLQVGLDDLYDVRALLPMTRYR